MLTYCLKYKKNTKNKDAKMMKTKNARFVLSSKCAEAVKTQNLRKNKMQKDY